MNFDKECTSRIVFLSFFFFFFVLGGGGGGGGGGGKVREEVDRGVRATICICGILY